MSTLEKLYTDSIQGVDPLPAPRPPNDGNRFFNATDVNLIHYIGPGVKDAPGTYFRVKGKVVAPPYPSGSVPDGSLFITSHGLPTRRNTLVEGADGYSIWQWAQSKPHSATNIWKLYYPRPATTPSITPLQRLHQENEQMRGMLAEVMTSLEQCKDQRDSCRNTLAALRTPPAAANEEEMLRALIDEFDGEEQTLTSEHGGYRRRKRSKRGRRRSKRVTRRKHRKRRRRTRRRRRRRKRRTRRK